MNGTPNSGSSDSTSTLNLIENVVYSRCSTHTYQSVDDREDYSHDCSLIAEGLASATVIPNNPQTFIEESHQQSSRQDDIHSCQTLRIGRLPDAGSGEQNDREDSRQGKKTDDTQSEEISNSTLTLNLCENIDHSWCGLNTYRSVDGPNFNQDCVFIAEGLTTDDVNVDDHQTPVEETRHYYVLENETQKSI